MTDYKQKLNEKTALINEQINIQNTIQNISSAWDFAINLLPNEKLAQYFIEDNFSYIQHTANSISDKIFDLWGIIINYWQENKEITQKIHDFYNKKNKQIIEELSKIKFDYMKYHPLLGKCEKQHAYFQKPLYCHLNPTEPQFTKALSCFLKDNQQSCMAFICAIYILLGKKVGDIKNKKFDCHCEERTEEERRIDDVIIWDDGILCVEVKFDAILQNNLSQYKRYIETKKEYKKLTEKYFIVISIKNITYQIEKSIRKSRYHNKSGWINLLWKDVLREWEQVVIEKNVEEDDDFKRYRRSLWDKIYKIGE